MSPTSYQTAPPRINLTNIGQLLTAVKQFFYFPETINIDVHICNKERIMALSSS
jgi:hypothetical protein